MAQRNAIAIYCTSKGITLSAPIYEDPGESTERAMDERPKGKEVIDLLSQGGTLVVTCLDRLERTQLEALKRLEHFIDRGVSLHIIDIGGISLNLQDATGKFLFSILAGFAEMQRTQIRHRTRDALQAKKRKGQRIGAVPYGFKEWCPVHKEKFEKINEPGRKGTCRKCGYNIKLVPEPGEMLILAKIWDYRQEGNSAFKTIKMLAKEKIKNRKGNIFWGMSAMGRALDRLKAEEELRNTAEQFLIDSRGYGYPVRGIDAT